MPGGPKLAVEVAVHRVLKQHQGSFLPCLTSIDPTSLFRLEQTCSHQFDPLGSVAVPVRTCTLVHKLIHINLSCTECVPDIPVVFTDQDKRVSRYQPDAKAIAKIGILKRRWLENVVATLRSREWAGEQMNRPDIVLARAVICIGRPNNDGPCFSKAANIDVGCGPAIAEAVWKQLVREGLA